MQTPESRPRSAEDAEKVFAKKPYAAPLLLELDGSQTKNGGNTTTDNDVGSALTSNQ